MVEGDDAGVHRGEHSHQEQNEALQGECVHFMVIE